MLCFFYYVGILKSNLHEYNFVVSRFVYFTWFIYFLFWFPYLKRDHLGTFFCWCLSETFMLISLCRSSGSIGVSSHVLCCLQSVLSAYVVCKVLCLSMLFRFIWEIFCYIFVICMPFETFMLRSLCRSSASVPFFFTCPMLFAKCSVLGLCVVVVA